MPVSEVPAKLIEAYKRTQYLVHTKEGILALRVGQPSKELADLSLYEAEAFEKLGKNQEALHCLDTALETAFTC